MNVARLTLITPPQPDRDVLAGTEVYLDREFFSGASGRVAISRRPNTPCLRYRAGDWWLDNDSTAHNGLLSVHFAGEPKRVQVPQRCSVRLPDGRAEVIAWNKECRLWLAIEGSAHQGVKVGTPDGERTEVGVPGAVLRVRELWQRVPVHRVILAAHYREYFTAGLHAPAPQGRTQTMRCMGQEKATQLDRALRETMDAVWGEQGHGEELPDYLISQHLLGPRDLHLVPHRACRHQRPGPVGHDSN
ncbi:hypothetical protein [Amycolatopsis sp. NPDC003861]